MSASNFDFLRAEWPDLFESSVKAEVLLAPDLGNLAVHSHKPIRETATLAANRELFHPVERAALETRISQPNILRQWWNLSEKGKPIDRRAHQLTLQGYGWSIDINGPVRTNKIGADENTTWPLSFWMGGWDGDALCAYISGYLSIPLASRP